MVMWVVGLSAASEVIEILLFLFSLIPIFKVHPLFFSLC